MTLLHRLLLLCGLWAAFCVPLAADEPLSHIDHGARISLAAGGLAPRYFSLYGRLAYAADHHLFTLRGGMGIGGIGEVHTYGDIGLLYGYQFPAGSSVIVSFSGGIGLAQAETSYADVIRDSNTPSRVSSGIRPAFPFEIQCTAFLGRFLAVELTGVGNINSAQTVGGATLGLQFWVFRGDPH